MAKNREPKKTKAELYEMLAEAVRNTAQPEIKRPRSPKRLQVIGLMPVQALALVLPVENSKTSSSTRIPAPGRICFLC